ncbi:MAG TPA: GNAT family protein [Pseudolysinimonas sp.]|nr:GNAT family protein [Pseudolysinimonas sp.]
MTATRPERRPIDGRFIRLEPFDESHIPALWRAIGRPEVFAGGYGGGPAGLPADEAAYAAWVVDYFPYRTGNTYVIRLIGGRHDGTVVGASSLADFDEVRESAHLGWTGYAPEVWSTAVNPEAKLLLLGTAFEHGYGRVKIQADARNERSRAAIAKLGATFEGIVRREGRRADGSWRDAAVFSVIVDDWPRVQVGLVERLAAWGDAPVVPELRF